LFLKLGVDGSSGNVDRPIVMTEPIANLTYPRRSMLKPCAIFTQADFLSDE
jgi:hypothetical protein